MSLFQLPNAASSYEEAEQVFNEDLDDMSISELEAELVRVGVIIAKDPGAFVWRGLNHITARQWADERVTIINELLNPERPIEPEPVSAPTVIRHRLKRRAPSWSWQW